MKALRAVLADRKRSQRGSILSAVLIIVAFLAIISGALMTALSTNFLLSNDLLNRVNTEATVNSAAELAISRLQAASLNAPCPAFSSVTYNSQTAAATVASCAAVIDRRSPQSFTSIASSKPFQRDGTHAQLTGLNDYVVGDTGGNVFDYTYGRSAPRWTLGLGGSVTATPLVMRDPNNPGQFLDLVPASGPICAPASLCINVLSDDGSSSPPAPQCTMAANTTVESQPAAGVNFPYIAFAGDSSGNVYSIDLSTSGTTCDIEESLPAGQAVTAGPVVFACGSTCGASRPDEVYVVTSNGTSSHLVHFTFASSGNLTFVGSLVLPGANASGVAVESPTLPSRLAISFAGGQVDVLQIDAGANMSLVGSVGLPAGINGAPYWCHCPGSLNLIGVGGDNGSLYVLNTNLTTNATYSGGSGIQTAPAADGAGNWYFAADNGRLYEVQKPASSSTMTLAASYGSAGAAISSSPVVGSCPAGICAYIASADAHAYLVSLDARAAVLTACISSAPPTCSAVNPRLWTRVEVGVAGDPREVHVQGWSYYSP